MALSLKNTLTKTLEEFVPLDPDGKQVLLYSCGPTVYSYAHIGNFRSFLLADMLRRVLRRRGYEVQHVMNITDVGHMTQDHLADASGEDKLSKAARELGWNPYEVARHFEDAFKKDAQSLRLLNYQGAEASDPQLHPRATAFVPEMLAMIQRLLEQGVAYPDGSGQVYFELSKFPEYGQLSGKKLEELEVGARVEVRSEKRDPRDFALWKADDKHLMQWDPQTGDGFTEADFARLKKLLPNGVSPLLTKGFPGWHIECSAMASACLGPLIDIHTGGEDNVFPHHECEIAQSCASSGVSAQTAESGHKTFSKYWVHGRHLLVDGHKMSKRDGTFFTVRDLLNPEESQRPELAQQLRDLGFADGRISAPVLRYALIGCSYTQPMNFSTDSLVQARSLVAKLQSRYERLLELTGEAPQETGSALVDVKGAALRCSAEFDTALDNNLDVPGAMAAVGSFVTELNQLALDGPAASAALAALLEFNEVLDVLTLEVHSGVMSKAELTRWTQPNALEAEAERYSHWRGTEREFLVDKLASGAAPGAEQLAQLTSIDAELACVLLGLRSASKKQKEYALADAIRSCLQRLGATVEDTPQGVRWKLN